MWLTLIPARFPADRPRMKSNLIVIRRVNVIASWRRAVGVYARIIHPLCRAERSTIWQSPTTSPHFLSRKLRDYYALHFVQASKQSFRQASHQNLGVLKIVHTDKPYCDSIWCVWRATTPLRLHDYDKFLIAIYVFPIWCLLSRDDYPTKKIPLLISDRSRVTETGDSQNLVAFSLRKNVLSDQFYQLHQCYQFYPLLFTLNVRELS